MEIKNTLLAVMGLSVGVSAFASEDVSDAVIAAQRAELAAATEGLGFGPQSPRDLDQLEGENSRIFGEAPSSTEMNLCNIHFHEGAEHRGGDFTTFAGNGDGNGFGTGFLFDGELVGREARRFRFPVCQDENGFLETGDTIELHYVYSSALVEPGPGLSSCISPSISNPQLRVEAQVMVMVNDRNAADFRELTKIETVDGFFQAVNIPRDTGFPTKYAGSTTGPSFNTQGSPLQVSWAVRPRVLRVDIASVARWCASNPFDESAAQGVRNLVINPDLLSEVPH